MHSYLQTSNWRFQLNREYQFLIFRRIGLLPPHLGCVETPGGLVSSSFILGSIYSYIVHIWTYGGDMGTLIYLKYPDKTGAKQCNLSKPSIFFN